MKTYLSCLFALLITVNTYALADTEIVTLNNNTAENVLPTVQGLLEPGGSVSAFQGKLIIKSSAQNIADIKNVLASIDRPARKLLISVRQGNTGGESNKAYDVNGRIQVNPNVTITHNSDGSITQRTSSETTVGIGSVNINNVNNSAKGANDNLQHISAMEGYPAYITIGQDVPFANTSRNADGSYNSDVEFKNVDQGFYVTAYVFGDNQVQLDVSTENDKLSATRRDTIDTQHASTTLSGSMGQWISVGGIDQSSTQDQNGILANGKQTKHLGNSIFIKVDLVP